MAAKCATCPAHLGGEHYLNCAIRYRKRTSNARFVTLRDTKVFECGCAVRLYPEGLCPHSFEDETGSLGGDAA